MLGLRTSEKKENDAELQHSRPRIYRITLFIITAIIMLGILSHALWLPAAFTYLDVSQPPQAADVIVLLGGGIEHRQRYAAWLYQQGYASTVLVSGHGDSIRYAINLVAESGVPESATLINDQATSTYDEAHQVLALLLEMDAHSALIVTNRFHTRRALATYQHVFQGHDIDLTIVSPDDGVHSASWWRSTGSKQIAAEFLKIPYYWLNYGVWSG